MERVAMRTPVSDIVDRYTILKLKQKYIGSSIQRQFNIYHKEVRKLRKQGIVKEEWIKKLSQINKSIWELECMIGDIVRENFDFEEIGRKALEIRELNRQRIEVKNKICEETGEGFPEIKIDHTSVHPREK